MRDQGFYKITVKDYDVEVEVVGYWCNGVLDMLSNKKSGYFDCSNYSSELKAVYESECIKIDEKRIC